MNNLEENARPLIANGDVTRDQAVAELQRLGGFVDANGNAVIPDLTDKQEAIMHQLTEAGKAAHAAAESATDLAVQYLDGDKPPTPEFITWADINPHWPQTWARVGNPIPIPGGALVLVRMLSKKLKRQVTVVMAWQQETGNSEVVKLPEGHAMYTTSNEARDVARQLKAALDAA